MADNPKNPAPKKRGRPPKITDKNLLEGKFGEDSKAIAELAAQIKEQNKIAQGNKTDKERNDKLDELIKTTKFGDSEGRKTALGLKQQFKESQERLAVARESGDEKLIALEEKNQESIASSAEDVEKSREAKKATEKQSKLLQGIKSGISSLASKFKDNASFLAGLAGVALAVFDPAKLQEIIDRTVNVIVDAFNIVQKIFTGDFKGALEIFQQNWADIGIALGLVVALNFGKIVGIITMVKNGLVAIQAAMAAAGIGLGPAVLIGAAIALAIAALVKTFQKVKSVFDETGSAFEAFKAGLVELPAQIFGIPFNLLKKAMTFMADLFGLETKYDPDFDFVEMFRNLFNFVIDGVVGFVKGIPDTFNKVVEKAPEMFAKVKDMFDQAIKDIVARFKKIGLMIKAFGAGGLAAIKAAAPFGESPKEAFDRVYGEVMSGGSPTDSIDQIDVPEGSVGEELDTSSMNNKLDGQFLETAAPPITVNQIDQSDKSTKTSTVHGGSRRDKRHGFNNDTAAAYA